MQNIFCWSESAILHLYLMFSRYTWLMYLKVIIVHHFISFPSDLKCEVVEGQGGDAVGGQQRCPVLHQLPSTPPKVQESGERTRSFRRFKTTNTITSSVIIQWYMDYLESFTIFAESTKSSTYNQDLCNLAIDNITFYRCTLEFSLIKNVVVPKVTNN